MIFLMAVVFSAVTFGIWPAVYASVLSFLAYNLFFIEPLYTFTIARPHELLALFIFLAISVVTSTMAGRIREQAQLRRAAHAVDASAVRIFAPTVGRRLLR